MLYDSDAFHVACKEILTTLRNSIGADAASRSLTGFRDISGVFDDRTETVFVDNCDPILLQITT